MPLRGLLCYPQIRCRQYLYGVYTTCMVKNRKPAFVSETAHQMLKERAIQNNTFIGDEVDIMLGLKELAVAQEENKSYFKEDLATIIQQ